MKLAGISVGHVAAVLWIVAVGLLSPAVGQQQSNAPRSPRPGEVEVESSRVFTFVQGTGLGHSHGMEAKLTGGYLVLGQRQNAGRLMIDMKSFEADTSRAREVVGLKGKSANWMRKQVAKEMHGAKILDSGKYPVAVFDVVSCVPLGEAKPSGLPTYQLTGSLTFHGQSRTVAFPVTVAQHRGWLQVKGEFSFKQSAFGIKPLSKGLGAIGVADEVTVFGDLWVLPTQESLASLQGQLLRR